MKHIILLGTSHADTATLKWRWLLKQLEFYKLVPHRLPLKILNASLNTGEY